VQKLITVTNKGLTHVNPRELGEEWCAPDFKMGPSYRPFFLLHYIFSGSGVFRINNTDHRASEGQLCILRPYEVMNYYTDPQNPWHYCWVGFECTLDIPVLKSKTLIGLRQAEHIFGALKDAGLIQYDREYYICGKLYELLSIFQQMAAPVRNRAVDFIFKVKHYIDSNYHLPITMEQLAESIHVSRSYFSTAFRKYVGRSPQQYLIDVRLERAAELLVAERCGVYQAAVRSGYADVYTFSRMFKKKYGVPPASYRSKGGA
jgi:AraC-like DNA-binding protein